MIDLRDATNTASNLLLTSAFTAGIGYLAARIFTAINPIHAAMYCGVASLVSRAVKPIFDKAFSGFGSNTSSKIVGEILSIGSVVVISSAISAAAGFSVPCSTGIYLLAILAGTAALIRFGDFALDVATEAFYG